MSALTKQQVLKEFRNSKKDDLFCPCCYETLKQVLGMFCCSNGVCANEKLYYKDGSEEMV